MLRDYTGGLDKPSEYNTRDVLIYSGVHVNQKLPLLFPGLQNPRTSGDGGY